MSIKKTTSFSVSLGRIKRDFVSQEKKWTQLSTEEFRIDKHDIFSDPKTEYHLGNKLFVSKIINLINPKEKMILELRSGLIDDRPRTLEEVGKEFGESRERIRQIEAKAIEKIRIFIPKDKGIIGL